MRTFYGNILMIANPKPQTFGKLFSQTWRYSSYASPENERLFATNMTRTDYNGFGEPHACVPLRE
ncbi:MAG: hypothetical protein B6245_01700 [Desulfobacteraceae bacterium 4572_88]|nr:MAG: hypothetical protein B6245_01700 [Desulfobacteraceae bacterium 4572_88]